jgi:hypothetical protein
MATSHAEHEIATFVLTQSLIGVSPFVQMGGPLAAMDLGVTAPARYFVFVRAADEWAILHRENCRLAVGRTKHNPCASGLWLGPHVSRIAAVQVAQDFKRRVRPCRNCKA